MFSLLAKRIKQWTRPARRPTAYSWRAATEGVFAGRTLYLPLDWGDEILRGEHELELFQTIQSAAKHGGVFYDIGTHYGWFTALWLQCGGASVDAFEPLAENRAIIQQTLERNGWLERVRIHSEAVGLHDGEDWLISYPGDTSRTFVPQTETIHAVASDATRQRSPMGTLSGLARSLSLPSPALIKINVEGLEGDVIEGAREFLAAHKPPVIIEVHSTLNGLRTADVFAHLGYQMQVAGLKGKKKSLPLVLWTHPDHPLAP